MCTLKYCFRNAALTLRNMPGLRPVTRQSNWNRLCPKTSSQASEVAISQVAHLAASTKMEDYELERRLLTRWNAPVNHIQLAKALQGGCYAIPMPILGL